MTENRDAAAPFHYVAKHHRFGSTAEIEALPNYIDDAQAAKADFDRGLGYYVFKEKVRCGRAACHRQHYFGFVVRLKSSQIIRVGNDCGAELFGGDFTAFQRSVSNEIDRVALMSRLRTFLTDTLPRVKVEIAALDEGRINLTNVDSLVKSFWEGSPVFLRDDLNRRAQRNRTAIYHSRKMTDSERAAAQATQRNAGFTVEEVVGHLPGISILAASPKRVFELEVKAPLAALEAAVADKSGATQLRKLSKELEQVEPALSKIRALLATAREFFSESTFSQFRLLATTPQHEKALADFHWKF